MEEQHRFFPSGVWEGIYKYPSEHDGSRHEMHFTLNFKDGVVTGTGTDDVGGFSWRGTYDTESYAVVMTKSYTTHNVYYSGMADEIGIYGGWSLLNAQQTSRLESAFGNDWQTSMFDIFSSAKGGFHLWPRKGGEEAEEEEVAEEVMVEVLRSAAFRLPFLRLQPEPEQHQTSLKAERTAAQRLLNGR